MDTKTAAALSSRKIREQDFHNNRFTEETRTSQHKFYSAIKHCQEAYMEIVRTEIQNKHALEYGCAKGKVTLQLSEGASSIIGIDISDVAVDQATAVAKDKGVDNVEFHTMDAERMSFPDESFDLVYGSGIVHHLDLKKCYSEVSRVLRNGGKAVFIEPLGENRLINAYRNRTPAARTIDEHPLVREDLVLAKDYFNDVSTSHYGLATLAVVPVRNTPIYPAFFAFTKFVDNLLFKLPFVKWQSWFVITTFTK